MRHHELAAVRALLRPPDRPRGHPAGRLLAQELRPADARGDVRRYRLRPGACYGADAWIWRVTGCGTDVGGCGAGSTSTFRCHDGWYKLNGADNSPSVSNGWTKTICKHRYACG